MWFHSLPIYSITNRGVLSHKWVQPHVILFNHQRAFHSTAHITVYLISFLFIGHSVVSRLFPPMIDNVPVTALPYPVHFLWVPPFQSFIWDPVLTKYHLQFSFWYRAVEGHRPCLSMSLWPLCSICLCPWASLIVPTALFSCPVIHRDSTDHGHSWPPWLSTAHGQAELSLSMQCPACIGPIFLSCARFPLSPHNSDYFLCT